MGSLPDQHLSVSLWIPLGVNNILALSEKLDQFLKDNRESLKFISWNGNIEVNDSSLKFILHFNSPDKNYPGTVILQAHFYGWGLIRLYLYPNDDIFKDKTLDPDFVDINMHFLIEKSKDIIVGSLLEHQSNYLSNLLLGNSFVSAEKYLSAAKNNKLDNGIMNGASDNDIKMGLRFETIPFRKKIIEMDHKEQKEFLKTVVLKPTATFQISTTQDDIDISKYIENIDVNKYREKDLLVKTIVLKRTATLQPPTSYDPTDGDFNNYTEIKTQCINGKHRSSLLIYEESMSISESIICQISGYNSLIRFQLFFISILKLVREEISLIRLGLLRRRGFKFAKNVPEYIISAEQMAIQGYVFYLISRMPLLEEIEKHLEEALNRLKFLSSNMPENSDESLKNITATIHQLKAYNDNLILATRRISQGLTHEVESVKNLIEIHDEESLLKVSTEVKNTLTEIKKTHDEVKQFTQQQMTMQKRSLETQFAQSEFARSGEVRMRVGRTTTQILGAVAVAGFLTTQANSLLASLIKIKQLEDFSIDIAKILGFNITILIPFFMFIFGWVLVGKYLSRTQKFGDIVEIIIPFNYVVLIDETRLFAETKTGKSEIKRKKRLHRLRVEGNMYRVTWEDGIEIPRTKVSKLNSMIRDITKKSDTKIYISKKVIATLEYTKDKEKSELICMTMSIEKSQVDNENMEQLQIQLRDLAVKCLYELSIDKSITEADWTKRVDLIMSSSQNSKPLSLTSDLG